MTSPTSDREDDDGAAAPGTLAFARPAAVHSRSLAAHFERAQARSAAWRAGLKALVEEHAAIEADLVQLVTDALQLREMAHCQEAVTLDLRRVLASHERTLILWALACTGGRQDHAAAMLGLGPSTLGAKIKRLGIAVVTRNGVPPAPSEA
jgi:DNA-binding NtrC family response regulator